MKKVMFIIMSVIIMMTVATPAYAGVFDDLKTLAEDNIPQLRGDDYKRTFAAKDGGEWTVTKLEEGYMALWTDSEGGVLKKDGKTVSVKEVTVGFILEEFNPTIQKMLEEGATLTDK